MTVTTPICLPVARYDSGGGFAGTPVETDDPWHALKKNLIADWTGFDPDTDDVIQFEVYVCGKGNRKSPSIVPRDMAYEHFDNDTIPPTF
jgi:hypothetical protein